jgi:hypothetical protein
MTRRNFWRTRALPPLTIKEVKVITSEPGLYGNDRPGLGVDINEIIAAKYPLKPYPYPLDWLKVYSIDGAVGKL